MMRRNGLIVAIDGPSGAGKSTVSRELARRLGYVYVDTGALYRVVALAAMEEGNLEGGDEALASLARSIPIRFEPRSDEPQRVFLGERDVTKEIRSEAVSRGASRVSAVPGVRAALLERQRELGDGGGAVIEGRDIGTVVFPDADCKFFLEAVLDERARRRHKELAERSGETSIDGVRRDLVERDVRDAGREHAPLRCADDAVRIDSTRLGIDEVVETMLRRCRIVLESRGRGE